MTNVTEARTVKVKALGALLVVFVMGAVVGGLGVNWYQRAYADWRPGDGRGHFGGPGGPGGRKDDGRRERRMLDHLQSELQLSPEQTQQIRQVLDRTRDEMIELRGETEPRFVAIRERSRDQIRAVLTPEQQQKFDQLAARRPERKRRGPGER